LVYVDNGKRWGSIEVS